MDAIVLAGGKASRLGGVDKGALLVGGRTLLEHSLAVVSSAATTVVVGPRRATSRRVTWAREEPAGGGPVAALAAGICSTTNALVAVIAVDLPYLTSDDLALLAAAATGRDGAIVVDDSGRDQPLAGVYRAERLRSALDALGNVEGAPMHALVGRLDLARVVNDRAAQDCDTPADLERVRATWKRR